MKVKFETIGNLSDAFGAISKNLGMAAYKALDETVEQAKLDGRRSIGAGGFSKRWQNSLRDEMYANGRIEELKGVGIIYHKIGYAGVFEEGTTITGKPMMWIPMRGVPTKTRRKKMTPERFATEIGDLRSVMMGGKPFLVARMVITKAEKRRGPPYKIRMTALVRGSKTVVSSRSTAVWVPVFMGIRTVNIKKRFDVTGAIERQVRNLPRRYEDQLRRLLRG